MRIVRDRCDGEDYVDVLMTEQDLECIKEYCLLSGTVEISGQKFNLGFKIDVEAENLGW